MTQLKWGETPFDRMSHEELLLHAKRMFMALDMAKGDLTDIQKDMSPNRRQESQWSYSRREKTISRVNEAIDLIMKPYPENNLYNNYYRYASSLLFTRDESKDSHDNWFICTECDNLAGVNEASIPRYDNVPHNRIDFPDPNCQGVFRKLTLDDMKPTDPID